MKCPKCNSENGEETLYCRFCQNRLKEIKIIDDQPRQNIQSIPKVRQQTIGPDIWEGPKQFHGSFSNIPSFVKKYLFLFLLLIFIITFFTRNNFRSVTDIMPEVLGQPHQYKIGDAPVIKFEKNGYAYMLTPIYDYEISALIVSKMNYRVFSIEKYDKVFPYDLCLIWGSNVGSGLYRNESLKFSQDCRWCFAQWYGDVKLEWEEFSNNHLLINNPVLESKIKSLVVGDQVKIKGQLVNVKAGLIGKPGSFDTSAYTWNSGVEKTGLGAGACKVIYVEEIDILKKANVISYFLFRLSMYGLFILIIWKVFCLFWPFTSQS